MRKLLMAAAIIVAVGALVFFLLIMCAAPEPPRPPERTGAPSRRKPRRTGKPGDRRKYRSMTKEELEKFKKDPAILIELISRKGFVEEKEQPGMYVNNNVTLKEIYELLNRFEGNIKLQQLPGCLMCDIDFQAMLPGGVLTISYSIKAGEVIGDDKKVRATVRTESKRLYQKPVDD